MSCRKLDHPNGRLLDAIDSPSDLKCLSEQQLPQLAAEMREEMIQVLAPIGGHLGAGLGVVELSIALHYIFDSPTDRIVWDVGHQGYPHKMLTGRREGLASIRQYGGLCGFTCRSESAHDPFGAGHSSTSISAAYGMAVARDLAGENHQCIAVIGDGALGGGMAFEALNHAGGQRNRLLVILNDNEMSIAPNVGALSSYLARVITGKPYLTVKDATRNLLQLLPGAFEAAKRIEEHIKGMVTPGTLFEELGFRYIGPIDGHDFDHLLPTLRNSRELNGPVLLHVLTKKGLGYSPAEEDPETWHGLGPYNADTGVPVKNPDEAPSYTQIFGDTLADLADRDARIVAITAGMPAGTGIGRFAHRHPTRTFDVGIAEQHAVTFAGGLAASGLRPFVAIYSTFMQRAYDQIVHDICIQNLPVVLCMDRAGIVGADGATHTGAFDIAFLRCLPNMVLMAPKDEDELRRMLATALTLDGPAAIRYPRGNALGVALTPLVPLPLGKAELIAEGSDGLIVAVGNRVRDAELALAEHERRSGQRFALLNVRFIKPLDTAAIVAHLLPGKPLLLVEEGSRMGGIGQEIAVLALAQGWQGPFAHLAMGDAFPAHGDVKLIRRDLAIDAAAILNQLQAWSGR